MNTLEQRIISISKPFNEAHLLKGIYIAVIHATRIPPHIGLIVGGKYHSLNVKGQDINTSIEALVKNTVQRKIPSLFIKIKAHPTFSEGYLKEHFITNVQQFPKVDIGVATCLSPIKLFFNEVFDVRVENINFLFELVPALYAEGLIDYASALFIDEKNYQLPKYSEAEINKGIMEVKKLALSLKK